MLNHSVSDANKSELRLSTPRATAADQPTKKPLTAPPYEPYVNVPGRPELPYEPYSKKPSPAAPPYEPYKDI